MQKAETLSKLPQNEAHVSVARQFPRVSSAQRAWAHPHIPAGCADPAALLPRLLFEACSRLLLF